MPNDIDAPRKLRRREADAEYAQYCVDNVFGADIQTLSNALDIFDALCSLEPEQFDPLMAYADAHDLPFEDAVVELVLKGLDA